MFKSRSFDLVNENELKQRDKLYDPKRCRWMNFIVIPALIGFMLLLILTNVDFTGTAYLPNTTETATLITDATTLPTTLLTTSLQFEVEERQAAAQLNIDSIDKSVPKNLEQSIVIGSNLKCEEDYNNPCKISCSGSVSNIKKTLETQQRKCTDASLEVLLHYCQFPSGAMKADFLNGYFYLHSLTISSCDLNYIWKEAFNQYSVSTTLKTLIFEKTQFDTLDDTKFVGLQAIKYFRLENNDPPKLNYSGNSFLKPIAATLNETRLVQYTTKGTKYTPIRWFTGANFVELLRVNLSNNYFPDTLENTTFLTLTNVQELILANCQINSMQSGTFDTISKTLQYLDLSNNQLKTLSADFLSNSESNLRIELSANSWNCTCDNNDLIKFIQTSEIELGEEPICTSPEDLKGINLKFVLLQCGDIVPTTAPATTTTTPATTTITPTTTIITTTQDTTEYTEPNEPQDSSTSSKAPATTIPSINDTTTENTVSDISDNPDPNDTTTITAVASVDTTITTSTETTITTAVDPSISSTTGTTETIAIDPTSNTTEPLPTTTTEVPPTNPVNIVCKDYKKPTVFNQTIRNYDALLGIYSESSTSVILIILNNMSKLSLIYFIPKLYYNAEYSQTNINSSAKVTSSLCERVVTTTAIHIEGLVPNQTYVFCLVPHDEFKISPFNCRSHQLGDSIDPRESWLRITDIGWLVAVVGIGIFVCVILGSCLVYWVLRWSPTLLYGSKRLINRGCKPHEMLLLPKGDRDSAENQYLSSLAYMRPSMSDKNTSDDNYDYMQFYKSLEASKLNMMKPENLPPSDRAPAIPSSSCSTRPVSEQSKSCAVDFIQHSDLTDLNNIYQSLDHYEHIG